MLGGCSFSVCVKNLYWPRGVNENDSSSLLSRDPTNCSMTKVNRSVAHDQGLRMQNLQLLVERIRSFYLNNMQQLVIGSLPNIVSICNSPESGMAPISEHWVSGSLKNRSLQF